MMKKLLRKMTLLFVLATMSTSAFAQFGELDFIRQDATLIIVESSQLRGDVNSLAQKMIHNHPHLLNDLTAFNQAYSALELRVNILNERIVNLAGSTTKDLPANSIALTQHMTLMSGEKSLFSSGNPSSGPDLRYSLNGLKNLCQEIRAEVMAMKNSSN